ncbi:ATP-binding cassette domain-containing protein [Lacticaseibacillus mingshuiensis]|uniref:ATP-binding cassette domain-containing protein n=1 Tax=Lacticaseibacillus mingshuiensis TaxID=2799574 RepID=A0ABW4CJ95_9LACO|nr:ABC transporter ATP-binding protein [Lacticaseibacillus mingshuiensis]
MSLLVAEHLSRKLRHGGMLLDDITLTVEPGEILTIEGENGAGKTVLLKALLGLTDSTGTLTISGHPFRLGQAYPLKAGILIENPSLINDFTAFQNLKLLATLIPGVTDEEINTVLRELSLDPRSKTRAKDFSLGMREKLGIAQALMGHQPLIVLDEPTNALDEDSKTTLAALVRTYRNLGSTFVIASHDREFIEAVTTRRVKMKEGHLIEQQVA